MFFRRDQGPKSNGAVFFLFVAILGTALLISVIIGSSLSGRIAIGEQPDIVALLDRSDLPESITGISQVQFGSVADSLTLFSYALDGRRFVALVSWNRLIGQYQLLDAIRLELDGALETKVAIEQDAIRHDKLTVFRVSAGGGVGQATVWIGGDSSKLVAFSVCGFDGTCGDPLITSNEDQIEFDDLTGDGQTELLVSRENGNDEVFAWRGDRLKFDQALTAAINARDNLFPEP